MWISRSQFKEGSSGRGWRERMLKQFSTTFFQFITFYRHCQGRQAKGERFFRTRNMDRARERHAAEQTRAQRDDKAVKNPSKAFNLLLSREESVQLFSEFHSSSNNNKKISHALWNTSSFPRKTAPKFNRCRFLGWMRRIWQFSSRPNTFPLIIFHACADSRMCNRSSRAIVLLLWVLLIFLFYRVLERCNPKSSGRMRMKHNRMKFSSKKRARKKTEVLHQQSQRHILDFQMLCSSATFSAERSAKGGRLKSCTNKAEKSQQNDPSSFSRKELFDQIEF